MPEVSGIPSCRAHSTIRHVTLTNDEYLCYFSIVVRAAIRMPAWSRRGSRRSEGTVPSPGGRSPGWPVTRTAAAEVGWAGCGIPSTSRGLPHGIPGAEPDNARTGFAEGCPGMPCGRTAPDRRDATPAPACKIDDPPPLEESGKLTPKLLTENQVLGERAQAIRAGSARSRFPTSVSTSTPTDDHGRAWT
jgi:hypothetical protein